MDKLTFMKQNLQAIGNALKIYTISSRIFESL